VAEGSSQPDDTRQVQLWPSVADTFRWLADPSQRLEEAFGRGLENRNSCLGRRAQYSTSSEGLACGSARRDIRADSREAIHQATVVLHSNQEYHRSAS